MQNTNTRKNYLQEITDVCVKVAVLDILKEAKKYVVKTFEPTVHGYRYIIDAFAGLCQRIFQ